MTQQPDHPRDAVAPATAPVSRRRRRFWLRGLVVALALGVLGWLALRSPDPVRAGDQALARAQAALASAPPAVLTAGPLQAGWGRDTITPDHPVGLFGYGERHGALSTGVADDLFVKALALDNGTDRVLVIAADLLLIPDGLAAAVRREVRGFWPVADDAILFGATHTHGAPNPWDSWAAGKLAGGRYDPEYGRALQRAFVAAAREAVRTLAPATLASGTVDGRAFVANRARAGNPIDSTFRFLQVRQANGQQCLFVNAPAHGTVLSGRNRLVSGDWQGWLQRHLEATPGVFAMVQAGAVGSVRPVTPEPTADDEEAVLAAPRGWGLVPPPPTTDAERAAWHDFARACALGRAVAAAIPKAAAERPQAEDVGLGHGTLAWDLPPPRVYLLPSRPLPPWASVACHIDSQTAFQALRVHDVVLVGLGGELSGELLLPLAAQARARGVELWVSSFSRDYKGYISPDLYYLGSPDGKDRYETKNMAWFGPRAGACFSLLIGGQLARFAPPPGP